MDDGYMAPLDVTAMLMNTGHLGGDLDRAFGTFRQWVHRGKVPDPDLVAGGTKLWKPDTIQKWLGSL